MSENSMMETRTIQAVTLEIKTLHRQAQQVVLGYAIEIGRRLVEAKALLPHGEWGNWLRDEVQFSQSSAQNFMRIFEEYGADQMGIFGQEAKSQTLGNLPYTKALRLLALPAEEREEFVQNNDVEELSTRELDKLIRERDEARRLAQDAAAKAEQALKEVGISGERNYELEKKLEEANKRAEEADEEAASLEKELANLRAQPKEVAVETVVDTAAVDQARKEAKAAAERDLNTKLAETEKKLKAAMADAAEAKKAVEAAVATAKQETGKAAEEAKAKAEALEKQLKVAGSPAVAEFKVHFEEAQREIGAMLDCLQNIREAGDDERHSKLSKALAALADYITKNAPEVANHE